MFLCCHWMEWTHRRPLSELVVTGSSYNLSKTRAESCRICSPKEIRGVNKAVTTQNSLSVSSRSFVRGSAGTTEILLPKCQLMRHYPDYEDVSQYWAHRQRQTESTDRRPRGFFPYHSSGFASTGTEFATIKERKESLNHTTGYDFPASGLTRDDQSKINCQNKKDEDFPEGPVAMTPYRGLGFNPRSGTRSHTRHN